MTETEKRAELIRRQNEILKSDRFFYCEKQTALITREQCVKNFKKAKNFIERDYLNKADKKPHWGLYGQSGWAHPGIKKCKDCETGKANAEKAEK
jgi:hypothetical protein